MSKSQRLRPEQLRRANQLVGECRELGRDALAWNRHLLEAMMPLVGAVVGTTMELRFGEDGRPGGVFGTDLGWATAGQRAFYFRRYVMNDGFREAASFQRFMTIPGRHVTRSRPQLVVDGEWGRSHEFNEAHRPMGLNDILASVVRLDGPPAVFGFTLLRPLGAPPYAPRDRRLAHRVLGGLIPHLRRGLFLQPGGIFHSLSERLRQTLRCLLEGDSEKQAALRLGLSRSTLHEHVSGLYRHFGVNSRPELLARCYRHCGPTSPGPAEETPAELPPRLRRTLACLIEGASEKQAARRLGLSQHTVHEYVGELYRRLGVATRAELIVRCRGLLPGATGTESAHAAPSGRSPVQ